MLQTRSLKLSSTSLFEKSLCITL